MEGAGASTSWGSEVPDLCLVDSIDRYDVWRDEWSTVGRSRYPRQMSSVAVVSPLPVTEGSPPEMSKISNRLIQWFIGELQIVFPLM